MIKTTIGNGSFSTEICFPCSETELSDKLGELGMNKEHLAPVATVLEIEPSELSIFIYSEIILDVLNNLSKLIHQFPLQKMLMKASAVK